MKRSAFVVFRFFAWGLLLLIGLCVGVFLSFIRPDISVEKLLPKYSNEASRFLEVDGMRVHLRDEGTGTPVVLLHGAFSSLHTWDGWVAELKDSYRIIRLDLPGHGLTGPQPDNDYTTQASLYLLEEVRKYLGIERWIIGGNSMGGRVALEYALHYPEQVEQLILVDAAASVASPAGTPSTPPAVRRQAPLPFRLLNTPGVRDALSIATPRFLYAMSLKGAYGQPEVVTDALVDRYYELLRREGNRAAFLNRVQSATRSQPLPSLPARQALRELAIPTLIQWGAKDSWIRLSVGEALHKALPNSQLIVYDQLGHVPMEEDPQQTANDVRRFLMEHE